LGRGHPGNAPSGFYRFELDYRGWDKKLAGVDCVQTLSRLNRTYRGKSASGTFILDFTNDPAEILAAFRPYYQTAALADVSDPNLVFDLAEKLRAPEIFTRPEVERLWQAFYQKRRNDAAVANLCKPAVARWQVRSREARAAHTEAKEMLARSKQTGDAVLVGNAQKTLDEVKREIDALALFKKDLGSFVRTYEFMSQIVAYDDRDLEKLCIYARILRPMLRDAPEEDDPIELGDVTLSHYRLTKIRHGDLTLGGHGGDATLVPGTDIGSARPKEKKEELLSRIITRMYEIFSDEDLSDGDLVSYANTIRDKLRENTRVMTQIRTNTPEQAKLGDFPAALGKAILESSKAHKQMMMQLFADEVKMRRFGEVIFEMLREAS